MPRAIGNPSGWTAILTKLGINSFPPFQLSEIVTPVAIVDSEINLTAIAAQVLYGTPASAGETAAPAANTRLADTGQLAAGNWTIAAIFSCNDANAFRLRRRNAADAADVWAFRWAYAANAILQPVVLRVVVAQNERFVIENVAIGVGTYQASIFAVAG